MARMQMQATGDTIENIEAVGDAEIKLLEIRERITGQRSEQLVNENSLLREQRELESAKDEEERKRLEKEAKAKADQLTRDREAFEAALEQQIEFDEIELERKRMNGEATNELEREILEAQSLIQISQAQKDADQIELIEAKKKLALDKLTESEEKANLEKDKAVLDSAIQGASEAFGISQELKTAEMIMAAPTAIGNSFTKASEVYPAPLSLAMGALGAAGTIAPIIKGLSNIKKTRFSKSKGGGSGSGGSISPSTGGSSGITPEVVSDLAANNSARLGLDTSIGSGAGSDAANNVQGGASNNIVFSEAKYSEFQSQVQFKEGQVTI